MKRNKKYATLVMYIITIILFFNSTAYASTTDTFTVTIRPSGLLLYDEMPENGATDIGIPVSLRISCLSLTGDMLNLSWYWKNETDVWVLFAQNLNVYNGSYSQVNSNFSLHLTTYYWIVNLSDGNGNYVEMSCSFTTTSITDMFVIGLRGYGIGMVMGIAMLLGLLFSMMGLMWKKRRRNENKEET